MEMPEIWQEVCLAFASWPEVVELSIYGLVLKKNKINTKIRNQCILIPTTLIPLSPLKLLLMASKFVITFLSPNSRARYALCYAIPLTKEDIKRRHIKG